MGDHLDALELPRADGPSAPLAPLVRLALVAMLDALEGRTGLPIVVLVPADGRGFRADDQICAPGWCADLRAALMRGDSEAVRELLAGPGRHAFAPYHNAQVAHALARAFGAALTVFEANARALAPTALPDELRAALAQGLAPATPITTTEDHDR